MGQGVAEQKLVVGRETLFEIDGEGVVDGGAAGEVGRHVREVDGDADTKAIAGDELLRQRNAGTGADQCEEVGHRVVEAGAAEEVRESGCDPGAATAEVGAAGRRRGGADEQRIGGGGGSAIGDGVLPVCHEQDGVDGVHVDRAVEMAAEG